MCFPHVINICCQHVIAAFTNPALASSFDEFIAERPLGPANQQTFEEAVTRDPVALGRNTVRALRSSGQRRDSFDDIVRDGNEKGWFQVGTPPVPVQLPSRQLLRDVVTRWDSVYYMITRLCEMHPVSQSIFFFDPIYIIQTGRGPFSFPPDQLGPSEAPIDRHGMVSAV